MQPQTPDQVPQPPSAAPEQAASSGTPAPIAAALAPPQDPLAAMAAAKATNEPLAPTGKKGKDTEATAPKNSNSTQNALLFQEVRDNMLIMGDGSFRAIVATQPINFDLMSQREREGIEFSYQQFLNMLNFPIQVFIHSQQVDIGPYLDKLVKQRDEQDNMLLGVLMDDYIGFIDALSQEANIMDKSFFVVIPYSIGEEKTQLGKSSDVSKGLLTGLFLPSKKHQHVKIPADRYQQAKDEMNNRVNVVVDGLLSIGVPSVHLKTKEIGALFYNLYNPDTALRQPIGDFRNYVNNMVVRKGEGEAPTMMGMTQ